MEVPRGDWSHFLDRFSRDHLDERCRVEVRGTDEGGAHELAHHMPLQGLAADLKYDQAIEVILGNAPENHMTHVVHDPARVWLIEGYGHKPIVQIEARDGTTTVVTLE